jgi:hypothetical protein
MNSIVREDVVRVATKAAIDVINGDAEDLPDAIADVDSPALRADAEWLAELLVQQFVEERAESRRVAV